MNALTQSRRYVAVIVALSFAAALAPRVYAHHAFATEFDASLEGEVNGTVTRVWWQNPHIRYDVSMKMPDGSVQEWALLPPGNLPTYRRENWTEQTVQVGYSVSAKGNLGREGAKKLYATCINLDSGPEKGRQLGRCVGSAGTRNGGHSRSERRLHRAREELPGEHHGLLGEPLQVSRDGRRLRSETDADDGRGEDYLPGPQVRRRPRAALLAGRAAADLRLAVPDAGTRLGRSLFDGVHAGQHAAAHLDGWPKPARGAAAHVDGLLEGSLGRPHARDRDDDAHARLARRLRVSDERRRTTRASSSVGPSPPTVSRSTAR